MTTDLVEFLRARLDEDERVAKAPVEQEWRPDGANSCEVYVRREDGSNRTIARCQNGYEDDFANSLHVARHDPARVLREVQAKRMLVDRAMQYGRWAVNEGTPAFLALASAGETMLKMLALPYADHPGYSQEWRP